MSTQTTPASRERGLRLMSFGEFTSPVTVSCMPICFTDAGGPRGISQLKILAHLMHRLNFDATSEQMEYPCTAFDMIAGAGSGG
jgi:hypothetical protein